MELRAKIMETGHLVFESQLQFLLSVETTDKSLSLSLPSVQSLSHVQLFATPWAAAHQISLSSAPGACSNSCPWMQGSRWVMMSRWCHPTISSSVVPFSSHLQSFPASGSFPRNQFFTSGGQSTGVSASASVLPMNGQDWFPLGLTGWISLQSKGLLFFIIY